MECGPACPPRPHGTTRSVRGVLRARVVAWLVAAHRRLIGGQATQGFRPALQGATWHGVVRSARRGWFTSRSTQRAVHGDGVQRGVGGGGR
jgi:hypothetical protein